MRVLALDLGERRIGVAISDSSGTLARPWRTITRRGSTEEVVADLARDVEELAAEPEGLDRLVIGLPLRLDGSPNEQTPRVQAFAEALAAKIRVPIALQDERLSSHEADRRLAANEPDWRKRKARVDAAAAAIILQDYLDRRSDLDRRP